LASALAPITNRILPLDPPQHEPIHRRFLPKHFVIRDDVEAIVAQARAGRVDGVFVRAAEDADRLFGGDGCEEIGGPAGGFGVGGLGATVIDCLDRRC
jgi:hypothetical protein